MKSSEVLICIDTETNSDDNLEIILVTVIRDIQDKPTHTHIICIGSWLRRLYCM